MLIVVLKSGVDLRGVAPGARPPPPPVQSHNDKGGGGLFPVDLSVQTTNT